MVGATLRIDPPKTQRGKRYLAERAPKVHENVKQTAFLRSTSTSQVVSDLLGDLSALKKPNNVQLNKRQHFVLFDDPTPLERLSLKLDFSLFAFGSHSKKRPDSLTMGCLFDHQLLDMFEFHVQDFRSMTSLLATHRAETFTLGTKPLLLFNGDLFDLDPEYVRLRTFLVDFFRGPIVDNISLGNIEMAIHFFVRAGKIFVRTYLIKLKKSGSKIPRIELVPAGPNATLILRRSKLASSDDFYKETLKVPREKLVKKVKNVSFDEFKSKLGKIHMQKQDLSKLQLRKMKALKRPLGNLSEDAKTEEKIKKSEDD